MRDSKLSKRDMLNASASLAAVAVFPSRLRATAPEPSPVTPALIEAARREGKVSFYSALELQVAERFGKLFEAKYPGITVRVERSGAERIFQRIGQEQASRIYAVDVANSTDPAHYLDWKRSDWLAPYIPEDIAKNLPPEHVDTDGMFATVCAWLEVIGYNTKLVKRDEAPKSYADLLDIKWRQACEGSPSLQRRNPHGNARVGARTRMVLFRKALSAEGYAITVGGRSAKKDPTR
jgi:iron(III) transport system substrate-binding protein